MRSASITRRSPQRRTARLSAEEARAIEALAARRLGGEPVARITGVKEFWGLPLRVTRGDAGAAAGHRDAWSRRRSPRSMPADRASRALRIADLGTGSGALLLALLSELPNAFGIATDISVAALAAARDNARRLELDARAQFRRLRFRRGARGRLRSRRG